MSKAASRRSIEERNELAMTCERLTWEVAHKWCRTRRRWSEVEDAASIGFIGLLRAAELWDETKGVKFVTYAWPAIYNEIAKHYESARMKGFEYTLVYNDDDQYNEVMIKLAPQEPESDYDDPKGLAAKLMNCLDAKKRAIIAWRYGIGCFPLTQSEIAKTLGVTNPRAQQLEYAAMDRLRRAAARA